MGREQGCQSQGLESVSYRASRVTGSNPGIPGYIKAASSFLAKKHCDPTGIYFSLHSRAPSASGEPDQGLILTKPTGTGAFTNGSSAGHCTSQSLSMHIVKGNPYQQLGPHSGTDMDAQGTRVCLSASSIPTSHITIHQVPPTFPWTTPTNTSAHL